MLRLSNLLILVVSLIVFLCPVLAEAQEQQQTEAETVVWIIHPPLLCDCVGLQRVPPLPAGQTSVSIVVDYQDGRREFRILQSSAEAPGEFFPLREPHATGVWRFSLEGDQRTQYLNNHPSWAVIPVRSVLGTQWVLDQRRPVILVTGNSRITGFGVLEEHKPYFFDVLTNEGLWFQEFLDWKCQNGWCQSRIDTIRIEAFKSSCSFWSENPSWIVKGNEVWKKHQIFLPLLL